MDFQHLDQVAIATVLLFVLGLAYDAGKKAEQIRSLNDWRKTLDVRLDTFAETLSAIKAIVSRRRDP